MMRTANHLVYAQVSKRGELSYEALLFLDRAVVFPLKETKYDAYLRNVEVMNAAGQNIDAYNIETFEDTCIYGVVGTH
ncbi:hypothetical protein RHSIM_Rhsim02G0221700 [Rhododendron simsii]|uniref:Uncharacterized protein n=1 Tax=Rhododendron simsii TaxID=118357 RepID=A0A834LXU2_RHOSS|nr:hypothetical protein RHSIM_Rhsim02G0221700 [Rhododendron simsii]